MPRTTLSSVIDTVRTGMASPTSSRDQTDIHYWRRTIILFRVFWAALFIFGVNALVDLGTSPWLVTASAALGVTAASILAASRMNWRGASALLFSLWLAYLSMFWGVTTYASGLVPKFFTLDALHFHMCISLGAASFAFATTWFFWRVKVAITVEAVVLSLLCIILFSGHRGYHFERPKIVNTLAWQFRADHLTMLLGVGTLLLLASALYIAIASRATRPHIDGSRIRTSSSGRSFPLIAILLSAFIALIGAVQLALYNHFSTSMLARVANGVGMESKPGVSPLTFQSALGSTNQPSALVRLEGDYKNNPYSPMLYLRENALSAFNGQEMVIAGRAYDSDLPAISPRDSFTGSEDSELVLRTPVVQSVYPLADHQNAFALDYPLSIVQLKNPQPNRFKVAYRAYSSAPGFTLSDTTTSPVGDPRWTEDVRLHYLVAHPDVRYSELAQRVTAGAQHPVEKVMALAAHLSKTSIYTLTPNHDVKKDEDQVAPFLFGDHRGYCVHFAHAMVYMARSLGIPARVGTGYLTDLSQSKDGHILLLMSDRHAWAEVYVEKYGWLPFDVQPEQVESHADNKVDPKLLEELMGILEPGEEILPPETVKGEPGMEEVSAPWIPKARTLLLVLSTILLIGASLKILLLHTWRFVSNPRRRAWWAYVAILSRLEDMGVYRHFGETRSEFSKRVLQGAPASLTHLTLHAIYASEVSSFSRLDVDVAVERVTAELRDLPWWRRFFSLLNPASLITFLTARRW